ncbi:MAG TPA: S8 family serine peptidase, partial [Candidatus Thermoplasmatota archaeon]|nr:S8 family serine peptidase [Candidatus Thermoplasmatota archaeon]
MRVLPAFLAVFLLVAPAAQALDVGARSLQARPSAEYSPLTAWDLGVYGCGVTIAVFDEGVDDRHPLLDGKVVAGLDTTGTGPLQEVLFPNNPQPLVGSHGTPVAGLATSHGGQFFSDPGAVPQWAEDDLVGVAPCAWMVDVMFNDLGAPTDDLVADMVQAFDWAVENKDNPWGDQDASNDGIDLITMSWSPEDGTDGTDALSQAANRAVEAGIVVLGSMGNSGPDYQPWGTPAAADLTLGIAALFDERTVTRSDDAIIDYSTPGPRPDDGDGDPYDEMKPDVASPAHNVVGPGASAGDGREYGLACFGDPVGLPVGLPFACETVFGGTSAATPMTAGVVALMLSANPALSPAEVKEILHQTAETHPDQVPQFPLLNAKYNATYGWGMTNAYNAVRMAQQWPGMERGRDRDSDGVRDFLDAAPFDPSNSTLKDAAAVVEPARDGNATSVPPSSVDSDGDQVPDAEDGAPLDPRSTVAPEPPAPGKDSPGLAPLAA